jgi:hypothetical protein
MLDESMRKLIRQAFWEGGLRTKAVDPESGKISLYPIKDVMQHHTGDRPSMTCQTGDTPSSARVTTTSDHSLFQMQGNKISPVRADELQEEDLIVGVQGDTLIQIPVKVVEGEPLQTSYDLCVPGPENFVLTNGILAHNSYSIGGISLDIEKSSKYESMKQNAEEQWDKLVEMKARTSKYLRGLQQPRFGRGVRSAFGPHVGRGVLSPRNFVIFLLYFMGAEYYRHVEVTLHAYTLSSLLS